MSLPVIFTRETGERVIVNWDAVSYIAPSGDDETQGSIIHFRTLKADEGTALGVRECLESIERRLQSVTRA